MYGVLDNIWSFFLQSLISKSPDFTGRYLFTKTLTKYILIDLCCICIHVVFDKFTKTPCPIWGALKYMVFFLYVYLSQSWNQLKDLLPKIMFGSYTLTKLVY